MVRHRSLAHHQVLTITLTTLAALAIAIATLVVAMALLAARLAPTDAQTQAASKRFGSALATGQAPPGREVPALASAFTFVIKETDGRVLAEVAEADLTTLDLASPTWRGLAELVAAERAITEVHYAVVSNMLSVTVMVLAGLLVVLAVAWAGRRTAVLWARSLEDLTRHLHEAQPQLASGAPPSRGQPAPRYAELALAIDGVHALLAQVGQERRRQHEYVSDVIHELRSPITALRTRAEAALMFPQRVDAATTLRAVVAEAGRLEELVTQLQVVAGTRPHQGLTELDVGELVVATGVRCGDPRVQLGPLVPARVRGDAALLQAALSNLLANAQRFARDRIRIEVQVAGPGDADLVLVHVDDDGPGIPAPQREAVFQRRVRTGPSSGGADHNGLGLGLPIARAIAEVHDGSIRATSSPLGGARLELALPAAVTVGAHPPG